jgi:hypothetical protein
MSMQFRRRPSIRAIAALALACGLGVIAAAPLRGEAATPATAAAPAAEKLKYDNKWRIVCNHSATSAGTITFVLTPKGAPPQELTVTIAKPVSENEVAREIRDQLKAQLDPALYHVETDDGEDVLVKKHHGAADFALAKTFGSVESVKITIRRD